MSTARLVFDIETIGGDFESLDSLSQEFLLKFAEDEEEEEEIKDRLALYPLTGEIVAIGVLNPDTNQGGIFVQRGTAQNLPEFLEEGITLAYGSETEMLKRFWDAATSYSTFITFNGRRFDVPYLMIRSAIHGIRPSKNLLSNRYLSLQRADAKHIDLADQLSFYGAAKKNFNLHMWAKTFGIKSPKEEGVSGQDITKLFKEGKIEAIARYNLGDLRATVRLYQQWEHYLNV